VRIDRIVSNAIFLVLQMFVLRGEDRSMAPTRMPDVIGSTTVPQASSSLEIQELDVRRSP
jgi:hypothetical protein